MSEFLHKKVRIEDNRLTSKGRIIANDKIADGITGRKKKSNRRLFVFFASYPKGSAVPESKHSRGFLTGCFLLQKHLTLESDLQSQSIHRMEEVYGYIKLCISSALPRPTDRF